MRRLWGNDRRGRLVQLILLCCLCFFASCSDDKGGDYPSLVTDLALVKASAKGMLERVTLDDGTTYDIAAQQVQLDVADTLMRCLAAYTLKDGKMHLYRVKSVFSDQPKTPAEWAAKLEVAADQLPRHPVKLVSAWRSGGFVNLHVGVLTTGAGKHGLAFCEDATGQYSLLHLRPDSDAESYTENVYLSMPIPEGVGNLTFSLATYDGTVTKTF